MSGVNINPGQMVLHGRHVWPSGGIDPSTGKPSAAFPIEEPAIYTFDWPAIAAGTSPSPVTQLVRSDRDFILLAITHVQSDDIFFLPLQVQLSRKSDGADVFLQPAYINGISSQTPGLPYVLPTPQRFSHQDTIILSLAADP